LSVKGLEELTKVALGVMGPGGRLRMILHGKDGVFAVPDPFHGAVIEVEVGYDEPGGVGHPGRVPPHREPMVLGRDKYLSRNEIADGMVAAPVPVGELHRLGAHGEAEQLVSEADPEDRDMSVG